VQIIRVEALPQSSVSELHHMLTILPAPPLLEARQEFDGFRIERELYASSRSHVYVAIDIDTNERVVIKIPSLDLRNDTAYLERFLLEEWVARRINSAHVLKPCVQTRKRNYIYIASEFIEGKTLRQWMRDNPSPSLEVVRDIAEQVAKGLQAFHRMDMLHQDIRPENIMIDSAGTLKIIDFGSTRVAGITEIESPLLQQHLLGTAQYSAPEYFLGDVGSVQSDQFSLAVLVYELLSGKLPYGAQVAKCKTRAAQHRLCYRSIIEDELEIPLWMDDVLKKALHPNPLKRYEELSEFIYDLRKPNRSFLQKNRAPLLEKNPVLFWQWVSASLLLWVVYLLNR
jgi:serine/threonine protein kinase